LERVKRSDGKFPLNFSSQDQPLNSDRLFSCWTFCWTFYWTLVRRSALARVPLKAWFLLLRQSIKYGGNACISNTALPPSGPVWLGNGSTSCLMISTTPSKWSWLHCRPLLLTESLSSRRCRQSDNCAKSFAFALGRAVPVPSALPRRTSAEE